MNQCPDCQGSGIDTIDNMMYCPLCDGAGEVVQLYGPDGSPLGEMHISAGRTPTNGVKG